MKRHDFARMVSLLLAWIIAKGWYPLIGDANRSRYEQNRLWRVGRDQEGNKVGKTLTNCDGVKNVSAHQYEDAKGRYGIDILIHTGDGNVDKDEVYKEAHEYWSSLGGEPMIPWDGGHWEAK